MAKAMVWTFEAKAIGPAAKAIIIFVWFGWFNLLVVKHHISNIFSVWYGYSLLCYLKSIAIVYMFKGAHWGCIRLWNPESTKKKIGFVCRTSWCVINWTARLNMRLFVQQRRKCPLQGVTDCSCFQKSTSVLEMSICEFPILAKVARRVAYILCINEFRTVNVHDLATQSLMSSRVECVVCWGCGRLSVTQMMCVCFTILFARYTLTF